MNILVRVDSQQIPVRLHRIVDFHPWNISISSKSPRHSARVGQRDDEVVDASQAAFHFIAGGQRDGHGGGRDIHRGCLTTTASTASTAEVAGEEPGLLHRAWV